LSVLGSSERIADPGYRGGLIRLVTATLFTSTAGVLVRLVESADGWTLVFYRSVAFVATMLVFIVWRHGRQSAAAFRDIGRSGLGVAVFLGAAFTLYIFALLNTTVANAVFTVSLSPFFAALFGWLVLRESVRGTTLLTMVAALVGVGFMFGDGFAAGTWFGIALALLCCLCYSAGIVSMRGGRAHDMLPAVCLAGVVAALVAGVASPDLSISGRDLLIACTLGVVQLAFQYILVTGATRHVPAAEVALVGRLALIMTPLWVWLAVGEVPGNLSLIGGAIVLVAVLAHGALSLRAQGRRAPVQS
jgi:DME family drug/metabolite transporter